MVHLELYRKLSRSYLKHDPIHALERIKTFYDWAQVAECTEIVYDTVVKSRQMVLCERVKRVVRPSRSLKILLDRMMGLGPFERPIYLIILVVNCLFSCL